MIAFIGGIFVGGFIGVMIMCVLSVAGQSDCDFDERTIIQYDSKKADKESDTSTKDNTIV